MVTVCGAEAVGAAVIVATDMAFEVCAREDIAERLKVFGKSIEDGTWLDE